MCNIKRDSLKEVEDIAANNINIKVKINGEYNTFRYKKDAYKAIGVSESLFNDSIKRGIRYKLLKAGVSEIIIGNKVIDYPSKEALEYKKSNEVKLKINGEYVTFESKKEAYRVIGISESCFFDSIKEGLKPKLIKAGVTEIILRDKVIDYPYKNNEVKLKINGEYKIFKSKQEASEILGISEATFNTSIKEGLRPKLIKAGVTEIIIGDKVIDYPSK